ncbi:hypothetical protein FHS31_000820 [Sphingomonas vulcanisoli]|uniref:HK97 gp10 family phage protein n=1 Tax=Sphingomonas vulcanisoli TaxID=1658060 RepID=A0ABX0TNX3_9SPHN|nr:hypothetical protein [Sphingomonas vulcanisoli]NIJ07224.1 hypothetical protein [Sphingomonas vulcanisoli]
MTSLAKGLELAEDQATIATFDHPTPFTQKAFATLPATKSKQVAIVFVKDVQEQYLAPYIFGGDRSLGSKKAMLVPIGAGVNGYGNLPRNTIARLKGKPNVFVGTITTKAGKRIAGVWQRPMSAPLGKRRRGIVQPTGHLKLLVEFKATTPAPKHFDALGLAEAYLRRNAEREFSIAWRKALSTARR